MLRYGQLHIVLVGLGLAAGTAAMLSTALPGAVLFIVGGGAWGAYIAERLLVPAPEDALLRPARAAWFGRHRRLLGALLGLDALAVAGALLLLPARVGGVAGATLLVGTAYLVWPMLQRHPVGKPLSIAAAWTLGGVALPIMAGAPPGGHVEAAMLYALARAATIAANVVLCDWPDRKGDAAAGRATLASSRGAVAVRTTAAGLLLLALALDAAMLALIPGPPGRAVGMLGPVGLLVATVRLPRGGAYERILLDLLVGIGGLGACR